MSTVITSLDQLPERRIAVQTQLFVSRHLTNDREIAIVKERMAMQIARKILEKDDLFNTRIEDFVAWGHKVMYVEADCIILTQEEYANIMREKFSQGLQHAQGFMPVQEIGGPL